MATIITNISKSKVIGNLDTYNHTALQASMYTASLTLSEVPTSGITVAIQLNGTPVITSAVPTTRQRHIEIRAILNCAINDVIGIVVSSSTPIDQVPNNIKGILAIRQGTV